MTVDHDKLIEAARLKYRLPYVHVDPARTTELARTGEHSCIAFKVLLPPDKSLATNLWWLIEHDDNGEFVRVTVSEGRP